MRWNVPYPETEMNLMGVRIHRLTRTELLDCFEKALDQTGPLHFAYLNVAVSNQAADQPEIHQLLSSADLVYVDGAGIQLGCRILGEWCPARNTAADFLPQVMEICARRKKTVGFLGGTPGGAAHLREQMVAAFPGLQITFCKDGYEDLGQEGAWIGPLQLAPPDLLLVGLGVPAQEKWIDAHRDSPGIRLYWSVGALFEYHGGSLSRCPDWMGRSGLEWLYRLWIEPRRLWKRYLIGNPRFLLRCLCSRWLGRVGML